MPIDLSEWITRVAQKRKGSVISEDSKEIPSYDFGKLVSDDLAIPPQTVDSAKNMSETSTNWTLEEFPYDPKDIRAIGTSVQTAIFTPFAQSAGHDLAECSIEEFQEFIKIAISPEYSEANSDSLAYLSALENALRRFAREGTDDTLAFSVIKNDIHDYPLYTWYLVMNLLKKEGDGAGGGGDDVVPALFPDKDKNPVAAAEVASETGAATASAPI